MGRMTNRLLATDFDGTLFYSGLARPADVAALHRWQEAGNLLVAATGRSPYAAHAVVKNTDLKFDYQVLLTGAVLLDGQGEVLEATTIAPELIASVYEKVSQYDRLALYATGVNTPDLVLFDALHGDNSSEIKLDFKQVTLAQAQKEQIVVIPLRILEPAVGDELAEFFAQEYAGVLEVARNQEFIDLVPAGCSKGLGLEKLVHHLGFTGETVTFGDSWNDLSMHAWAQTSFSFDHSPAQVKQATTHVVPDLATGVDLLLQANKN